MLRQLAKHGVNTSGIILDAPLVGEEEAPTPVDRTLRTYLDTPLWLASASLWDRVLDWIGGYSDVIDRWIDRQPSNFGDHVVQEGLVYAGKWSVPLDWRRRVPYLN